MYINLKLRLHPRVNLGFNKLTVKTEQDIQ